MTTEILAKGNNTRAVGGARGNTSYRHDRDRMSNEAIGVGMTQEQVKRLTDKDVEKYNRRYETDSLIDSFIFLVTKAVGAAVDVGT